MIKLFIAITFIYQISTKCNKGCLKCSINDECLLCDFINKYILNENHCV